MRRLIPLAAALALLAGCVSPGGTPPPPPPPPAGKVLLDWRAVIRPDDLDRLQRLGDAWTLSLRQARSSGHAQAIAGLGELVEPRAAASGARLSPGDYRCRTIKLGAKSGDMPAYVAYDWFRCRVEQTPEGLKLSKTTGSQRPVGLLYPDSDRRMIFLGSLALGDETQARAYGADPERDIAGVVERLPSGTWRVALPWPRWESNLDVIELRPAR